MIPGTIFTLFFLALNQSQDYKDQDNHFHLTPLRTGIFLVPYETDGGVFHEPCIHPYQHRNHIYKLLFKKISFSVPGLPKRAPKLFDLKKKIHIFEGKRSQLVVNRVSKKCSGSTTVKKNNIFSHNIFTFRSQ